MEVSITMEENIFKNYSNRQIAQMIYDGFVKDKTLNERNIRTKFDTFFTQFWSDSQFEEQLLEPEFQERQNNIFEIIWFKVIELEKEYKVKDIKILNTKSDEELADMLFDRVKTQKDLSSISLGVYWSELGLGVEDISNFPKTVYYRWEKINNMVWQRVKELKKQRRHEAIEKERKESFKLIDDIIEWVKEKGLKKLSKINLKLYLSEKKLDLVPVNRQALYLEVNKVLRSKK
jgi:hypothetical protein